MSAVSADARQRSLRTFAQGLGVDIAVAGAALIAASAGSIDSRAAAGLFAASLGKTVLTAAASYVLRYLAPPPATAAPGAPLPGPGAPVA